ncbi:MAG: hypothetical protein NTZ01_08340 [Verrucomicrobia bacterium]|nr:hypothetical protein [Verrucomicrobiota bacterium]
MSTFKFQPAAFIPFRDRKAIDRVRRIKRKDITRHKNPDFRIQVVPDVKVEGMWITDILQRIQQSAEAGQSLVHQGLRQADRRSRWGGYLL